MMDTNHSTRTPIPEIYTSSTKYFEVRDKKGYVSRTREIPDDRKRFGRMECGWRNENCLRLRSRYRCGSRTKYIRAKRVSNWYIPKKRGNDKINRRQFSFRHPHSITFYLVHIQLLYIRNLIPRQPVDLTPTPQLLPLYVNSRASFHLDSMWYTKHWKVDAK